MNKKLEELIRKTRDIQMTEEQFARQRRSFVYGNTNIENQRITRQLVDTVDAEMSAAEHGNND